MIHRGPLPVALLFLAFQSTARAHLAVEGIGEIGNGMLHPVVTPAHVLVIIALALLLGPREPLDLKRPMIILAATSALALALTTTGTLAEPAPPILIGVALCLACGVAWGKDFSLLLRGIACAVAGIAIGVDSAAEPGPALATAKTLTGTWLGLNALVGYLALCASNAAGKPVAGTGIRVLGSWIIAITLLMLAFSLRK